MVVDIENDYGIPPFAASRLMTNAEFKLYKLMDLVLNDQLKCIDKRIAINCKVRLADLFKVNGDQPNKRSLFNQICCKHIDFTIIDPETGNVICLVELNDFYHNKPERSERDKFIGKLCKDCNIQIVWIDEPINEVTAETLRDISIEVLRYFSPKCSICGGIMKLKRSQRFKNLGHLFYECMNKNTALNCSNTIDID